MRCVKCVMWERGDWRRVCPESCHHPPSPLLVPPAEDRVLRLRAQQGGIVCVSCKELAHSMGKERDLWAGCSRSSGAAS